MSIFDDLQAEQDRLQGILDGLTGEQWLSPSAAAGWTVADVVLHLAQTEELVVASAAGAPASFGEGAASVDEAAEQAVRAERAAPPVVFQRWRKARQDAMTALRAADPQQPLRWVGTPLMPTTLATTRLAEHWAHGLDIAGPLGIGYPDTGRLRHIAWLAHRSLAYAFALAGREAHEVFCDLTAPDGTSHWQFGPAQAESAITGPAGAFCRVAAQRLSPERSGLTATGPHGAGALTVLRTYAA